MSEWQEYERKLASLSPDQRAAEIAKLTPDQRRALEEVHTTTATLAPPAPPRKRKVWPWVLGCGCLPLAGLAALFIVGVIGAGGFKELEKEGRKHRLEQEQREAQRETSATPSAPADPPAPSAPSISAIELVRRYDANEIAADRSFKGQLLLVDGIVEKVGKDVLDSMYVSLKGPEDSFRSVQCAFSEEDTDALASLTVGQSLKLIGRADGLMVNVQLKECKIVQ